MDGTIRYLNTDLDVCSHDDLSVLISALGAQGLFALMGGARKGDDGRWHVTFETDASFEEPEPNIAAMIDAVESLDGRARAQWSGSTRREFNIGYDCGSKPWAYNQGLSSELLGRIAAIGASLRLTLYPPERAGENAHQE